MPISSVEDLAKSRIKYGSISSGSTASFFRDSNSPFYKKLWKNMASFDNSMVNSNSEGVSKVIQESGGYAFFMESTSIEYQVERNCKLTQIGGLLDSKSYGIAMPQGSRLRSLVSSAIIKLRDRASNEFSRRSQSPYKVGLKLRLQRKGTGQGQCIKHIDFKAARRL